MDPDTSVTFLVRSVTRHRHHDRATQSRNAGHTLVLVFRLTSDVDPAFLARMLAVAVSWDPDRPRTSVDALRSDPVLVRYIEGWGRAGDDGLVALALDDVAAGAVWIRQFSPDAPGYGFVDADTPELSIAVDRDHRGRGAGSLLLAGILGRARARGVRRISLSVERENAARSLYERFGFVKVDERDDAWTMVNELGV